MDRKINNQSPKTPTSVTREVDCHCTCHRLKEYDYPKTSVGKHKCCAFSYGIN